MKLARFCHDGQTSLGLVEGDAVSRISGRIGGITDDMIGLIAGWDELRPQIERLQGKRDHALSDVTLRATIARPGKIWAIGLNYADHIAETRLEPSRHQLWFTKAQTAITDPYQSIELPLVSDALDYEAEMVVVVGKVGRHIRQEKAGDYIFGYAVGNDVSVRDFQMHSGQFSIGKSFDTHAPFGPWIVTSDEIDSSALPIRTLVNGIIRQESNTRHMIHTPAAQLAYLSQAMTMEPGDLVFTGTPGGVGMAMEPPQYLAVGDRVRVEIDGIGFIENRVERERA